MARPVKTILVTGARGFLGRHLCDALEDCGHRLHRVQRAPAEQPGVWCVPDLAHEDIPDAAFEGVDLILHLAADMTSQQNDATAQMAARVARAGRRHRIERLVLMSSVAARIAETDPMQARAYGRQKQAAETAFATFLGPDTRHVVLRPPVIYGPGAKGSFGLLSSLIRRGLPLPVSAATAPRSYLSVGNLISLVICLVNAPDAGWDAADGACFEPHDGAPISTRDLVGSMARAMNQPPRIFWMPRPVLRWGGRLVSRSDQVEAMFEPLICADQEQLNTAFGWSPHETMPESLRFLAR